MAFSTKSRFINRTFYSKQLTTLENSKYDPTLIIKDQIIMSIDCISSQPIVKTNDITLRHLTDIIGERFLLGYNGHVFYYVLLRKQNEPVFTYWDVAMVVKDFLNKINYKEEYCSKDYSRLATKFKLKTVKIKQLAGKLKIPKLIMVGYLLGDTVSSFKGWYNFIDVNNFDRKEMDKTVTVYQNALLSYNFIPFSIPSRDYKRRAFLEVKMRDNIALSSPKEGIDDLASMFGITLISLNGKEGSLYRLIQNEPEKFSGSVITNYQYLGFIAKQTRKIYEDGLIPKFSLPSRLSELGDKISDHFFNLPYSKNQVDNTIKSVFAQNSIDNFLRPLKFDLVLTGENLRVWERLIDKVKGRSDLHLKQQDELLKTIESYLARNTIIYRLNSNNKPCRTFNKKRILRQIDFNTLYKNNPDLNPNDLLKGDYNVCPKSYNPDIPNTLKRNYRKNKFRFKKSPNSNRVESIDTLLQYLWSKSVLAITYKKEGNKLKSVTPDTRYLFSQKLDFKYLRNGFSFIEKNSFRGDCSKNRKTMNTIKVSPNNRGFGIAVSAFKGGLNQAYDHGIINEYRYVYSPDLKSSYPMSGSFIPDFRTDVEPAIDKGNIDLEQFNRIRNKLINGDFTLGVCICSYEFPDNVKRIPVGTRANMENDTPHYVRSAEQVSMTLTDAINIIRHGVKSMHFDRIIVPVQKNINCSEKVLSPVSRAQRWGIQQREKAREKYGDESPEQNIFKSLVNIQFGKSGQGLIPKSNGGRYKYISFSRSTNPFIAAQFTSITRYLVCALADTFEEAYPTALIPSITTDGMCLCTNEPVDKDKINILLRKKYPLWGQIVDKWFHGTFFKFKSKLTDDNEKVSVNTPLINIKTRFNFTTDGRIKALAGIANGDLNKICDCLKQGVSTFMTQSVRKSNPVQLKQRNYKHLQAMWNQNVYQNLGYDDSNQIVSFCETGNGLVHYQTKPFLTVEQLLVTKYSLQPYRRLFPFFKVEYANLLLSLDNSFIHTKKGLKIKWISEDVPLKNLKYTDLFRYYKEKYLPKVLLRYLAQNKGKYNLKEIYQDYFSNTYSTYSGFNQAVKRSKDKFVNPFVMLKENLLQRFEKYELNRND